jgi:hemerythrin-like domain-containing protein
MDALETLLEEHEIIKMAIGALDAETRELQAGNNLSQEKFETLIDIIRDFADKCHHGKEEDVLFPLIAKRGANEARIVSSLLEEHRKGRSFVKELEEAVGKNDVENAIRNANGYNALLLLHIKKENAVFPVWINPLPDETKKELEERFEEIEERVIGLGKHEEYVQRIKKLESL